MKVSSQAYKHHMFMKLKHGFLFVVIGYNLQHIRFEMYHIMDLVTKFYVDGEYLVCCRYCVHKSMGTDDLQMSTVATLLLKMHEMATIDILVLKIFCMFL